MPVLPLSDADLQFLTDVAAARKVSIGAGLASAIASYRKKREQQVRAGFARATVLSPERRSEIARMGGASSMSSMTLEARQARARHAGYAAAAKRWGFRPAAE